MRRFRQELSADVCADILKIEPRGVLAVSGDGGYHCATKGHKLDAINRDGRASFCVLSQKELSDDGWSYFFESVIAFGRVSTVTDEEKRTEKLRLLGNKYFPSAEITEDELRKNAARALLLELKIEHMTGKRVHER